LTAKIVTYTTTTNTTNSNNTNYSTTTLPLLYIELTVILYLLVFFRSFSISFVRRWRWGYFEGPVCQIYSWRSYWPTLVFCYREPSHNVPTILLVYKVDHRQVVTPRETKWCYMSARISSFPVMSIQNGIIRYRHGVRYLH